MFGIAFPGGWEWILIAIVALLIFGKRLPSVMRSLGRGVVEFKKGIRGIEDDIEKQAEEDKGESKGAEPSTREETPKSGQ